MLGQREHAVDLLVVHVALGARQHGVVIGDHHAACAFGPEFLGVHRRNAGDQPVRRRVLDQVLDLAAAALRGNRKRAVFDKRAGIDELGNVLARGALVGLAPPLDCARPVLVTRDGMPRIQLGEISADMVEIDLDFFRDIVVVEFDRLQVQDRLALHQGGAAVAGDLRHLAAMRRVDQMLHLHGFQHRNLLAGSHQVAFGDIDGDDGSLQRRRHRHRACGTRRGQRGLHRRSVPVRLFDQQRLDIFGRADEIGDMRIDEAGRDAVGREVRMRQDRGKERDIGGDTADAELTQRAAGLLDRILPLCASRMHDDLGEQGIERGTCPIARIAKGIDAHAGAGRQIEHAKRPAGRLGRACFVHGFHVDAKLHGIAARFRHIGLRQPERAERGAVGDRKLRPHEVDAENLFRHGMLDLQPRIGLDEGKRRVVAVRVVINQELEGAEIVVMRGGGELLGGFDDARAQGIAERRAGRDLDELLVAPLDGAFALPEMADRAMTVADDLHLDVAGLADQPLDIDVTVAECGHRLGLATRVSLF